MKSSKKSLLFLLLFINATIPFNLESKEDDSIVYARSTEDWYPSYYSDEQGYCGNSGVFIDILYEIFVKNMALSLNCKKLPWKRAQKEVMRGNADFLITFRTEERLTYTTPSTEPVFSFHIHVFTYKNHPKLEQIKAISSIKDILRLNLVAATNIGNGWHKNHIENLGVKTYELNNDTRKLIFLASKRADIIIDVALSLNSKIRKIGLQSELIMTSNIFSSNDIYIMLSKNSRHHHRFLELDTVIKKLNKNGVLESIAKRHQKY